MGYISVAVVGFEAETYTVSESAGEQEVCVRVSNPRDNEELQLDIVFTSRTRTGSAGKFATVYQDGHTPSTNHSSFCGCDKIELYLED